MNHDYRDVLLKAASYVEQGWTQGAYHRFSSTSHNKRDWSRLKQVRVEPQSSCAVGAIDRASLRLDLDIDEADRAIERVADLLSDGLEYCYADDEVTDWNDADGRTQHEVAEALRKAAE